MTETTTQKLSLPNVDGPTQLKILTALEVESLLRARLWNGILRRIKLLTTMIITTWLCWSILVIIGAFKAVAN